SVGRMPCIITPYHLRLDWQVWIDTTASLESRHGEYRITSGDFVPAYVETLCSQILEGKQGAAGLMGARPSELYVGGMPPAAIKAEMYRYQWSTWASLLRFGHWWQRELVSARPIIISSRGPHRVAVKAEVWTEPQAHPTLLLASFGAAYISLQSLAWLLRRWVGKATMPEMSTESALPTLIVTIPAWLQEILPLSNRRAVVFTGMFDALLNVLYTVVAFYLCLDLSYQKVVILSFIWMGGTFVVSLCLFLMGRGMHLLYCITCASSLFTIAILKS
ncbi:hypothetical protein CYMTET_19088, partial [Cymbomonas tetramitiformis]